MMVLWLAGIVRCGVLISIHVHFVNCFFLNFCFAAWQSIPRRRLLSDDPLPDRLPLQTPQGKLVERNGTQEPHFDNCFHRGMTVGTGVSSDAGYPLQLRCPQVLGYLLVISCLWLSIFCWNSVILQKPTCLSTETELCFGLCENHLVMVAILVFWLRDLDFRSQPRQKIVYDLWTLLCQTNSTIKGVWLRRHSPCLPRLRKRSHCTQVALAVFWGSFSCYYDVL